MATKTSLVRIVGSVLGIVVCLLLIFVSSRIGFARLLARYATTISSMPAATEAIRLAPRDAETHRAQALLFRQFKMYSEAAKQLEIAVSLRPSDDYLWLDLGTVRDELGDSEGALRAFDQAVARAPYYAHTKWQRANLRLRMGRYDEAFTELREAAKSNRRYLPTLLDLAWALSNQDAPLTQQLAGVDDSDSRITYTRFLARKGRGSETIEQFRLVKSQMSDEYRREVIRELLTANSYQAAFEVWSFGKTAITEGIHDGSFESVINLGEAGFGWEVLREPGRVSISVDPGQREEGTKSLRLSFDGNSEPSSRLISQTVLVKPLTRYRLEFSVKAKDIVSGGLPFIVVRPAAKDEILASSTTLPQSSDTWQKLSLEFATPENCDAVLLSLTRNNCATSPCPIFGILWLDSFSLKEIPS